MSDKWEAIESNENNPFVRSDAYYQAKEWMAESERGALPPSRSEAWYRWRAARWFARFGRKIGS